MVWNVLLPVPNGNIQRCSSISFFSLSFLPPTALLLRTFSNKGRMKRVLLARVYHSHMHDVRAACMLLVRVRYGLNWMCTNNCTKTVDMDQRLQSVTTSFSSPASSSFLHEFSVSCAFWSYYAYCTGNICCLLLNILYFIEHSECFSTWTALWRLDVVHLQCTA